MRRFGFGNWTGAQEYMAVLGASYFKDELELHYNKFYGNSSCECGMVLCW
jgi:hypothetical protein